MNIDKDIEIVKNMFYEDETFEPNDYVETFFHKNEQLAIKNILSELEKKYKQIKLEIKGRDTLVNLNTELSKELETYKKIAEKLAELLLKGDEVSYICDLIIDEHCNKYKSGECVECIIDWARKEVEKDDN